MEPDEQLVLSVEMERLPEHGEELEHLVAHGDLSLHRLGDKNHARPRRRGNLHIDRHLGVHRNKALRDSLS